MVVSVVLLLLVIGGLFFYQVNTKHLATQQTTSLHKELQAIYDKIPTQSGKSDFLKQSNNLTQKVDAELVDLDSQIITCDANVDGLVSSNPNVGSSCVSGQGAKLSSTKGLYMGGQCCGVMTDTKEYHERLNKLQAYKNMPDIILDPMHTPIDLARKWIDYDNTTALTPDEQKVYDDAYAMSKEKPCCCKCWHYFVDEGIAKKMIKDGKWNSKQISVFWDNSEICGV